MVFNQNQNTKQLICGLLGAGFMFGAIFIFIYNPVEYILAYNLKLREGGLTFEFWQLPPTEVFLSAYVFNVTNHEAFEAGNATKLNFEEIGPFVYQEILHNSNAVFNENGTLTYEPKRQVIFRPERSVGVPEEMVIIAPNVALLGIASAMEDSSMLVNFGLNQLTTLLNAKPMLNLTVYDFFWGYDDPLIGLANNLIPSWITFERLGVLDRLFDEGTNIVTMNIEPSIKPSRNILLTEEERMRPYGIQLWNGSPGFDQWGYQPAEDDRNNNSKNTRCNMIEGVYDGVIFPRPMTPETKFRVYRKAFCRSLPIVFDYEGKSPDGFRGYFFKMQDNAFETAEKNIDNKCYCRKPGKCLPRGFSDITPCYYGIPTAVSQPHFYNADPAALEKISGLRPNKQDHDIFILLHPDAGVPLWARSRCQTNVVVRQTKYNSRTRPYNNMIIPVFWTELKIEKVPDEIYLMLSLVEWAPTIQLFAIFVVFAIGFTLFTSSLITFFWIPRVQRTRYFRDNKTLCPSTQHSTLSIGYSPVKIIPIKTPKIKSYAYLDRESKC